MRETVQGYLDRKWSPEQIAAQLHSDFLDQPETQVAHETIYQTFYLQARRGQFRSPMLMISRRPAEVEDRAVPGHWEGDLIIGKDNASAIGTVVERSTRYVLLVAQPHSRTAGRPRPSVMP